jgi:hypothetical protein
MSQLAELVDEFMKKHFVDFQQWPDINTLYNGVMALGFGDSTEYEKIDLNGTPKLVKNEIRRQLRQIKDTDGNPKYASIKTVGPDGTSIRTYKPLQQDLFTADDFVQYCGYLKQKTEYFAGLHYSAMQKFKSWHPKKYKRQKKALQLNLI